MALHEACIGVQVHTGTRIHWDAHQTFFFFVRKSGGGGGGSPSKFFGNLDLKKHQITDDPQAGNFSEDKRNK